MENNPTTIMLESYESSLDLTREWLGESFHSGQQFEYYDNLNLPAVETQYPHEPIYYPQTYYPSNQNDYYLNYVQSTELTSYGSESFVCSLNASEQSSYNGSTGNGDFFEIDDIIQPIVADDELYEVLSTAGLSDLLNDSTSIYSDSGNSSGPNSVSSTPKRKYSTDSSSDCLSLSSFDTATTLSPASSDDTPKPKRFRRAKHTKEERAARKKDQNKKAACKYRSKKKDEKQTSEHTLDELEAIRDGFNEQILKLRTEFNVILPLAQASFAFDSRNEQLQQLIQRLNTNNLL